MVYFSRGKPSIVYKNTPSVINNVTAVTSVSFEVLMLLKFLIFWRDLKENYLNATCDFVQLILFRVREDLVFNNRSFLK